MAVTHFIASVWSKKIQDELEKKVKLASYTNQEYEGDVKFAAKVKILGVGDPTVRDYPASDNITVEDMSDIGQWLEITQKKYFAFKVEDLDAAQSVPGLPGKYQKKAAHKLAIARDTFVAGLMKSGAALAQNTVADDGTISEYKINSVVATDRTGANIKAAIDRAIVALREGDFDEEGRIEITPGVYNILKNVITDLSTNNPEYIKTGKVGLYDGFEVVEVNTLAKDTTYEYCDIRSKDAIAFAGQINEVESMRMEGRFADLVRGFDVYGSKVIDPKRIEVVKIPVASGSL